MNVAELYPLIRMLADGHYHSGEELASRFGISRAAIWKRIRRLAEATGLEIESRKGKGYRLPEPLELLEETHLVARIGDRNRPCLQQLHLLPMTASTNDFLRSHPTPLLHSGIACLAEHQLAGRGRRGRQWVSVFGRNILLSLAWRFELPLADLAGLSIAAGVALARLLERYGVRGHGLKWPNDLHLKGAKVAGILVEAGGEVAGPCQAIIGVGLNLRLPPDAASCIDQPCTDLASHLDALPGRNDLAGDLLDALIGTCVRYQQEGITPFLNSWQEYDLYVGRAVDLLNGDDRLQGTYVGLNEQGGLILEREGVRKVWYGGEVSLRGGRSGG